MSVSPNTYTKETSVPYTLQKMFVCNLCKTDFPSETDLQLHNEVHAEKMSCKESDPNGGSSLCNSLSDSEKDDKQFVCDSCKMTFKTDIDLDTHRFYNCGQKQREAAQKDSSEMVLPDKLHEANESFDDEFNENIFLPQKSDQLINDKEPFICFVCEKHFIQEFELTLHLHVHFEDKSFICNVCQQDCTHKICTSHYKHNEKPFVCDICEKDNMENNVHSEEKKHICELCKKVFSDKYALRKHSKVHTGEKPFVCKYCIKAFTQKSDLTKHLRIHMTKEPFVCDICKKSFSEKRSLQKHTSVVHSDTALRKKYVCDVCLKAFARRSDLTNHHRTHTGEKPFECNVCKKAFSENSSLLKHLRVHTGEKPYACGICQKAFSQKSHLSEHYCTHTGEKPFVCHICSKAFTLKKSLQRHNATHTGERPYVCDKCQKTFTRKQRLDSHLETHMKHELKKFVIAHTD